MAPAASYYLSRKSTKEEEIEHIKLTGAQELVASLVDGKKLDLGIWVESDGHKRWTKRGLRFYPFDSHWVEFRKLIDKVDEAYKELAWSQVAGC